MRSTMILVMFLVGIVPIALAGGLCDLTAMVGEAFDSETGTLVEGAYDILIEAHGAIAEAMAADSALAPGELEGLNALNCMVAYNLGCLSALAGDPEEAFLWLGYSVESGYPDPEWMAGDPDLSSLIADARFQVLLDGALANRQALPEPCGGTCGEGGGCCGAGDCE
jgi:hypothetical protein